MIYCLATHKTGVLCARIKGHPGQGKGDLEPDEHASWDFRKTSNDRPGAVVVWVDPPIVVAEDLNPMGVYRATRAMGFTGDTCSECQAMAMKRNGSCLVCTACGTTTGCS